MRYGPGAYLRPGRCPNFDRSDSIYLTAVPGLHDYIAVRHARAHTYRSTFRVTSVPTMMSVPPPAVMIAVADDDIITIANNHLGGHRNGGYEHRPYGRTKHDLFHFSLLCLPRGGKRRNCKNVSYCNDYWATRSEFALFGSPGVRGPAACCLKASRNSSFGSGGANNGPCPISQPITVTDCRSAALSIPTATAALPNR